MGVVLTAVIFATLSLTPRLASAKVVVFFPFFFVSHVRDQTNVARAVTGMGHEAWVCIPESIFQSGHVDTSGINVFRYGQSLGDVEEIIETKTRIHGNFWNNKTMSLSDVATMYSGFEELAFSVLQDGIVEKVETLKPDLFVVDGITFVRPLFVVPYKLGVPYAVFGATLDAVEYRTPFNPTATPMQIESVKDKMELTERLQSVFTYFVRIVIRTLLKKNPVPIYAPDKPHVTLDDLVALSEVFIVELDPIMDYPRPTIPNVKLVGGTAVKPAMPLKDPFKSFSDKSSNGVVLVSFGSSLLHFPRYIFHKINAACAESGLRVVWRSNYTSPDADRILTSEWVPQNDILGDRNTKLFISHCGKNGQYEALFHAIPMLCLPIFGDQKYNAERVRAKGFGLKADMRFATKQELSDVIKELLTNTTYKDNIRHASKLFRQLYKSPKAEAAFWLDHVMQHGGAYMRSATQKMPLYQFFMLDVLCVLLFGLLTLVQALVLGICLCCRFVGRCRRSKSKAD